MSSINGTPRASKRQRSPSNIRTPAVASRPGHQRQASDASESSLPPSSPLPNFSDTDDNISDRDNVVDAENDIPDDEDGEGEDLFDDGLLQDDYAPDARLDTYDAADLDDENEYENLSADARRAAEAEMARRDRSSRQRGDRAARRSRAPAFLQDDDEDEEPDTQGGLLAGMKKRTRRLYDERKDIDDAEGIEDEIPLEHLGDIKADSIAAWIATESVQRAIEKHFLNFLMTYVDEHGASVYGQRIRILGELNAESLEVSYLHLADSKAILAYFLVNCPAPMLSVFDTVALRAILLYYPNYERIHSEIHVRITELPTSSTLRDLRRSHLNSLVRVSGVVTRRSGVFPQLKYVKFDCTKCGTILGPFYQDTTTEVKINFCTSCESKGPFQVNSEQTVYRNYQKMTLQESPGSVPAGRLPRHREVILLWDLIDSAKPGDEVEVSGIYRNNFDASLNSKNGFPVFSTVIEANHINKKEDLFAAFRLTEEDEKQIRALARDERISKRIIKSIAPSIYGHENIKTALALSLFGGQPKDIKRKHRIRGDINVLLLGDPGTAKSQFLKYVEKTAHRAVFTTGQGASAVGLTASVRKDPVTREWTLEGGALVLADKGHCLIDEFDKMNDADRTSIHEAMEQQSISIAKAGIVTTLQARCAIIAAANPIRGRYNSTIPFQQNVELTEPILSRFDVLCVVKDTVDPVVDELLARFVVDSHLRSHPKFEKDKEEMNVGSIQDADIIPQDLLRKYIMYAREKIRPKLHDLDQGKISNLFVDLRRESLATGSFPITVRHLESMIRMAEASAKMHLREYVRADDVDLAIQVAVGSFVSAQKTSIKKTLERGFRKYLSHTKDHEELLAFLLGQMVKERVRMHQLKQREQPDGISVQVSDLDERAKEHDIFDTTPFLKSRMFSANGYTYQNGIIEKVFRRGDDRKQPSAEANSADASGWFMDYLRNLGSAAASSLLQKSGVTLPFSLGEKIISFEGKTIWSLYDAVKRDDSSQVSVFAFDANQGNKRSQLPLAKNALRKLRTIRHPDVLKFVDIVETDTTIHIVTERVQPLSKALTNSPQGKDDWLCWGLHRVTTALAFVNESCASTHGNLRIDSIFVANSGEWRLGGFELLSNAKDDAAVLYTLGSLLPDNSKYASPEVTKNGWSALKELPIYAQDAYSLGLLIFSLYNPNLPLPSNNASTPPSRGSIPNSLFTSFKKLLNPNVKARLTPKAFLETGNSSSGYFVENPLVKVCKGLSDFALSGEGEKLELLRTLKESSDSFPPSFTLYLILPSLMTALQHAGATAPMLLPLILHLSSKVPPSDYNSLVLGPLVKLYASPDRGTRMALLDYLSEYADKLDEKMVVNDVWPHLQTGFTDTVAVIREATVRSVTLIAPKLSGRILNNDLLRHLARAQTDQEPSIRTNTAILLGRLAPSLSVLSRRKVLVPAFTRAVKDSFVHARVAGLMAFTACGELFEPEDMAKGVLPVISWTLIDGEKLVRDQAFKTVEYFVKRLEEHASNMPETAQVGPASQIVGNAGPQSVQATLVNSAAGAAGALAGWAISSLGKKLTPNDMQTGIGAESSTSAPATAAIVSSPSASNAFLFAAAVHSTHSAVHSVPTSPRPTVGKGMQLGATKTTTIPDQFVAQWAVEETTDAWDGDLMDVNDDADDWSAFETAPINQTPLVQIDDNDDAWDEPLDDKPISIPGPKSKPYLVSPKPLLASQLSPIQTSRPSLESRATGRSPSPNPSQPTKSAAVPSMVGMNKEEKAAEMARRKEERKQRIAALKEAKNKNTSAT